MKGDPLQVIEWTRYQSIVVLTGAGISAASGLGTYRGKGGLWEGSGIAPEATGAMIEQDPWAVWCFFIPLMEKVFDARPNPAHLALAHLESRLEGDFTLITQNVDGLHLAAGSREVVELHGSLRRRRCLDPACTLEPFEDLTLPKALPLCELCGHPLRPDIVLFGEQIPLGPSHEAKRSLRSVDLFLSVGTSGTVRPAANFVSGAKFSGALTVEINLESSGLFEREFLGPAEIILPRLVELTS